MTIFIAIININILKKQKYTPNKKWHFRNYLIVCKPLLNTREYTRGNFKKLYNFVLEIRF